MKKVSHKLSGKTEVTINPDRPLFVISVVSEMVGMPVWTLRKLDGMGVVSPDRIGKKTRCYTKRQIEKLVYVQYLMEDKHVNISAIQTVLEIESIRPGSSSS